MRDFTRPDGRRILPGPLYPLGGPISVLSFTTLLVAGFLVLAVLCSGLRDPVTAFQDWKTWARGGSLTVVHLTVGAVLSPMPSANHTFQVMDWAWGARGWDMRWLRLAIWIAPPPISPSPITAMKASTR